jgi:hypothetical protein
MSELAKVVRKTFTGCAETNDEEVRAKCLEKLEYCRLALADLVRQCQPYVRFSLEWRDMDRKLEEIEHRFREDSSGKSVDALNELLQQLIEPS